MYYDICTIFSTFSTVTGVLEAAQHMVAMQIARDPLVRQCVRQTFYERAKLKIKPTKKGKKVGVTLFNTIHIFLFIILYVYCILDIIYV